jgi:hypothetical protein
MLEWFLLFAGLPRHILWFAMTEEEGITEERGNDKKTSSQ